MELITIMGWFQFGCILLGLIFSVPTVYNKDIPDNMKGFYWYSIAAFCGSLIVVLNNFINDELFSALTRNITTTSILCHYLLLSYFFYKILRDSNRFVQLRFLFYFFLILITTFAIRDVLSKEGYFSFAICNFSLMIFCLFYYHQIFKSSLDRVLINVPSFLVATGVFIGMAITVPLCSIELFFKYNFSVKSGENIIAFGCFAYGIMHLFFCRAYWCAVKYKQEVNSEKEIPVDA